jgi:hypothetical protein
MNLQQFVTLTLDQIVLGVTEAKKKHEGFVTPELALGENAPPDQLRTLSHVGVFPVAFDVAVTVSETTEGGGKGGVTVLSVFSIEGGGKRAVENSSVSRVKFKVPVAYP